MHAAYSSKTTARRASQPATAMKVPYATCSRSKEGRSEVKSPRSSMVIISAGQGANSRIFGTLLESPRKMACRLVPTGSFSRFTISRKFKTPPGNSNSYFIIFTMSRHCLAQSRQDLAHAAICLSSVTFSHATAQSSQHFAQHSAPMAESSLWRPQSVAHILQHSAQSTQRCMHLACSFFPSTTSTEQ